METEATAERERTEPPMPLRDADLRHAATEHEVRPGDPLWGHLVELQRRRDGRQVPAGRRGGA